MICLDCSHAIIRVLFNGQHDETFYSCRLDGRQITAMPKMCNRYALDNKVKTEADVREPVWNKGRDKRRG